MQEQELVPLAENDETPAVFSARMIQGVNSYKIPDRMIPSFESAIEKFITEGSTQQFVEYAKLLQLWFQHTYAPPASLFQIAHYTYKISAYLLNDNEEKVYYIELYSHNENTKLTNIPVSDFAKFVENSESIEALGDEFFGEAGWQKLKRFLNDND